METPPSLDHSTPSESVTRCRKLAKFLNAGRITFEEYASNVTLGAVYGSIDDIPACVATVPAGVAAPYADYVRTFLEPVDFMPCPRPFLAGGPSEEAVEEAKRRLRPKYLRLYQLVVRERPGGLASREKDCDTGSQQ
ncbi:hypothetical protein V5E97_18005 [Singulisphaera sp. Ch08]|uniref:Uncharacterized protein n=1 Tax=Singulisphaera sp. Ch08 TaxID=3120278 RepID=A0AAU7CSC1_9BACT